MSLALNRESFFWHKVQSITGIIPVGYYMVQHLVLNSFSLAGPAYFNSVIAFFEGMPKFFLLTVEVVAIWLPLIFHAVYGLFIIGRAKINYFETKYGWAENRMYTLQRYSGIVIFLFLIVHWTTTTGAKYLTGDADVIRYNAWYDKLHNPLWIAFYMVGITASCYHLAYGIWNFCVRWGITISESAQIKVQKFSLAFFVFMTLVGWGAMAGFLIHPKTETPSVTVSAPNHPI